MDGRLRILLAVTAVTLCVTTQAQSALVFDDSHFAVRLDNSVQGRSGTQAAVVHYHPEFRMRFLDAQSGDAVVVRWKKGRRTLAEIRCPLQARHDYFETTFSQRCWTQDAPSLDEYRDITLEIAHVDDSADTTTLVRTLSVPVGRYSAWDRRVGNRNVHSVRYQVRPDDLLGMSTIWYSPAEDTEDFGNVYFHFWTTLADGNTYYRDPSWRCSLNGERVAALDRGDDVVESVADISIDDDRVVRNQRTTTHYTFRQMWIKPHMLWDPSRGQGNSEAWRYDLSAHPGDYRCELRDAGRVVREFRFTVGADGRVAPHAIEAAGTLTFRSGMHLIETHFPSSNASELGFDQSAVRRSVAFGRTWPAASRSWLQSLPRSYGQTQPAAPPRR